MGLNRRQLAIAGTAAAVAFNITSAARARTQAPEVIAVSKAVEAFRVAMLAADKTALEALCTDHLSYGHSSGRVETKAEFLAAAASGKTTWKSLTFSNGSQSVLYGTGIERHTLIGETVSEGKTTAVNVGVLMVWQWQQDGHWRLLARQAYRL